MTEHEVMSFDGCVHALKQLDLRQSLYDEASLMMEHVLVNLHGSAHRARRNVEATVFRKDVFLHYEKSVLPQTLEETLAPFRAAGRGDMVDIGYRIMMNLTVDFAGIDRPLRTPEETGELLRLLMEFSLAPALGQSRPEDIEPKKARIRAAMEAFDRQFLAPSLARRQALWAECQAGRLSADALDKDVLMALVMGQDKLQMSPEEFVQEGIFYLMAGAHTTIHSLSHAIHEILEWIDGHPEDRETLRTDPYFIQRCVYESVRLHPSSPVAKRRALCPVTLHDEIVAQPDDQIVINLRAANRSSELFGDNADRFDPHREIAKGPFRYGLSMGHGMHACLGRNLAIGVDPRDGQSSADHQYGTVPLIVEALLKCGIQRDPSDSPQKDETITRITWARYPVLFLSQDAIL
ncbi:hypothetical protein IP81_04935 [Novosphingobium sp. AAP83]|uniref:cytochrome P450 n=1 Tax=Novosphingobium sp. AAP83 TaxID=1523425 RepID=UPI0006B98477|nr:cytochrome P450 [Novosphingobium sp. AAP83]KPF92934.1 hypothetical protein IP81_04935 [Novosphingobium sp. AAP83]